LGQRTVRIFYPNLHRFDTIQQCDGQIDG